MVYAIIALVALTGVCAWLVWRCVTLRQTLGKAHTRIQQLQRDRAIRQNLQQVVERREAEIHRLRDRVEVYENDNRELQAQANELNVALFQEKSARLLAEKEDAAKRLQLEQMEQQAVEARRKLRQQQDESAEAVRRLQDLISAQDKEIARLRQANARRLKKSAPADPLFENQVKLDDLL